MFKNKSAYLIWCWGTTIIAAMVILAAAGTENLTTTGAADTVVKVSLRMLAYSLLFILLYRSIIASLKSTVTRLSKWRNRNEASEDAEFVLIIETLSVITTILATTVFASIEEFIQSGVAGRSADIQDVLVSVMAILLTALVVYTIPAIGELEYSIKRRFEKEFNDKS